MTMYFARCARFVLLGVLVFGSQALVTLAEAQTVDDINVPPVPTNIQVPAGHSVFLAGHAIGTQNFICLAVKKEMAWRFTGPQATLFTTRRNNVQEQLTTHFLSPNPGENGLPRPTWQHSDDTSAAWARAIASSTDPAYVTPESIPWLLLEVAGAQLGPSAGDVLARSTYIQRLNTTGGLAPSTGCSEPADIGAVRLVPYTADYFFYRADQ